MTAEGVNADEQSKIAASTVPVTWHYSPLVWDHEADHLDEDDVLEADGDDWRYSIAPVFGSDGAMIGYQVSGGDYESSDQIGSVQLGGARGELTLASAKAAAQANYAARYCEAERFLDDLLDNWESDRGEQIHRNEQGRIVCRVDEATVDEVEVVVTLRDYGDRYDAARRSVTVSLRTVLSFSYDGDSDGLLDDLRRLIRLEDQNGSL